MVWDELYLGAEEMAANCDVEPSIPCLCVAQRHRMSRGGGGGRGRLTAPLVKLLARLAQ